MKRNKSVYAEDVKNYVKEMKKLKEAFERDKGKLEERFQVTHIGEHMGPECICDKNLEFSEILVRAAEHKTVKQLVSDVRKT